MAAGLYGEMQVPWVPVLLYHRVVPRLPDRDPAGNCVATATFASHLRWLARRAYRSMTVSELARCAALDRGQRGLRVAITFDDGYEDNLVHALPLLRHYGFSATVFVVTDTIGSHNDFDAHFGGERVRMLSKNQIRSMVEAGIEIGSHTCSHPHSLPQLTESALHNQVQRSRSVLEDIVGLPVRSFSYPYSRVSPRAEEAVAKAGYEAACAGVGTAFTPYRLSRVATAAGPGPFLEATMRWRWLKHAVARRRPLAEYVRKRAM